MPLNVLTIFAVVFLVMGVVSDLISVVGEGRKYFGGDGQDAIPMVGFVFYSVACFIGWLYLPYEAVAWGMAGLTVFHLVCQYGFGVVGGGKRRFKV